MSVEKILGDWKKSKFKPIYWLEGRKNIILIADAVCRAPDPFRAEAGFNLTVFYGKMQIGRWSSMLPALSMFAERQGPV